MPNKFTKKTIVDIEPEDQYNYQSLSQRLNVVENENEILFLILKLRDC